jgi:hypothetical protein
MQPHGNISDAANNHTLLSVGEFEAHYQLIVNNEFIMGKSNPAISLSTQSRIFLQQSPYQGFIYTSVQLDDITGKTDDHTLNPYLQQLLTLSAISRKTILERNARGEILRVYNKETLQREWQQWKATTLPQMFDNPQQQQKFAANYEKGLLEIENAVKHNLNYYILAPGLYGNPPSAAAAEMLLPSKLIADMLIRYRWVVINTHDADTLAVSLIAEVINGYELQTQYLSAYYNAQEEYTLQDYSFSINLDYHFEKQSGKILSANLLLKEKMHDHLQYILSMELVEIQTTGG